MRPPSPASQASLLHFAAGLQTEPPVVPDAGEARRWASEELAKQVYRDAQPRWLEELWQKFVEWLNSLDVPALGVEGSVAGGLLAAAAVVLIAVAVVLARPRRNARVKTRRDVFDAGLEVSADDYRGRAAAAAAASDWGRAVVEQFRGLVRAAEERTVIDPQPGRTADEVAAQLSRAFAPAAPRIASAAGIFDAVRYGDAGATAEDHSGIAALDRHLGTLQPDYRSGATDLAERQA